MSDVYMPDETYRLLMDSIDVSIEDLNDKIEREEDYTDEDRDAMEQKIRDLQESATWLKIATGHAFDFEKHFTVIRDANGDPVEATYPESGREIDLDATHHVWTVLDCDGLLCIAPGFHWVNRVQHLLTTEKWTEDDEKKEWIY